MWTQKAHKENEMRTEIVKSRVEPEVKREATKILDAMDMTMSSAFNLFLKQLIIEKRIPFEIKLPNAETIEAIKAAQRGEVRRVSREELRKMWNEAESNSSDQ